VFARKPRPCCPIPKAAPSITFSFTDAFGVIIGWRSDEQGFWTTPSRNPAIYRTDGKKLPISMGWR
jgi:hypothetical protein